MPFLPKGRQAERVSQRGAALKSAGEDARADGGSLCERLGANSNPLEDSEALGERQRAQKPSHEKIDLPRRVSRPAAQRGVERADAGGKLRSLGRDAAKRLADLCSTRGRALRLLPGSGRPPQRDADFLFHLSAAGAKRWQRELARAGMPSGFFRSPADSQRDRLKGSTGPRPTGKKLRIQGGQAQTGAAVGQEALLDHLLERCSFRQQAHSCAHIAVRPDLTGHNASPRRTGAV